MIQLKPLPESPCGASTKCLCQFERRCLQILLSKPQQRATATSTDTFHESPFEASLQAPATDRYSRAIPLSGHQRRASATGLTTQNLLTEPLHSPALRPTLLSASPYEDTEKTSASSTRTSQPPLAGILLRCQLRQPRLPSDPPFEVSVQSTSRSNLHSQLHPSFKGFFESACYHRFDHH